MSFIGSRKVSTDDQQRPYSVFLSFRGVDTRKTFISHLHKDLEGAGLRTFLDDDGIERGENIKSELEGAINESRSSIIVFSKNYPSSKWCLDELVLIMKKRKSSSTSSSSSSSSNHFLLPVFYHVDPSHVRYQSGIFKERFDLYESRAKDDEDDCTGGLSMGRLKGWRDALREAANIGGMDIENQTGGNEAAFIEKIVNHIKGKVENTNRKLCLPPTLIGIDYKVQKINWWLQDGSTDVGFLAICGMGGIGKTTSARYVFNLNCQRFESSCFLSDIKDAFKNFPYGIMNLQKQLLSDLLFGKEKKIKSIDQGVYEIGIALMRKKVLLVFDDVEEKEQLDAIIGMGNMFYEGSKIIITTRHLRLHNPPISNDQAAYRIHNVEKMYYNESLELFSWHAFGQDHPAQGYEELSKRITHRCDGLPLALKVLGAFLSERKDALVWGSELKKLEAIPNSNVLDKLKVSYDGLQDDHDRNLFLDIACFFIGEDKNHTVTILDACGGYTMIGLANLMDRCLLSVDMNNRLVMHQMLQDMGREINRREHPNDPGKRRRLWCHKDSCEVLEEDTGTEAIEGLVVDMHLIKEDKKVLSSNIAKRRRLNIFNWLQSKSESDGWNEILLKTDAFRRMNKLKILHINYSEMRGDYAKFPKKIVWFRWDGCPLQYIPSNFPLERSVAVEIRHSDLKAGWEGNKFLGFVKILDLSHTHSLSTTPNFSKFPNLESLIMKNCSSLAEVDESIGKLENSLIFLDLEDCTSLRDLPRNTVMLHALETLIISGCSNLEELPANMEKMKSLKTFKLDRLMINQEVTSSYTTTVLDASWHAIAHYLALRPRKILVLSWESLPRSLVSLSLGSCNLTNNAFPRDFDNLPSLQYIDLSGNPIRFLPECIRGLARPGYINFRGCTMLQSLIGLPDVCLLDVYGCIELKKVARKSRFGIHRFAVETYGGLVVMEPDFELSPVASTETELLSRLSLTEIKSTTSSTEMTLFENTTKTTRKSPVQVLHESCGLFSIFFPGSHVPDWLSCRSDGISASLSTTMPSCLRTDQTTNSNTIYSVNVCFVYSATAQNWEQIYVVISNETKDLKMIYAPTCFGCKDKNHEDMIWISYWKLRENMLEPGDKLNFSLLAASSLELKVKEIGVEFSIDDPVPHEDMPQTCNREKKACGRSGDTRIFAYGTLRNTWLFKDIGVIWDLCPHDA